MNSQTAYELVKAFHIIFVITWFAALFYLPRLFVYHADTTDDIGNERFKVMERKLFVMMTIGGTLAILFGLWLWLGFGITGTWLHIKLALVLVLIGYHIYCGKIVSDFRNNRNRRNDRFYRMLNEFPTLILFAVVILVVVKPFSH
ncbi:MAG: CopD family protein [Acidiferrobacterales bacterium]